MEANEIPQGNLRQEIRQENRNIELEQKASELAIAAKQHGIVNLYIGQRITKNVPPDVTAFIQGEEVNTPMPSNVSSNWGESGYLFDLLYWHSTLKNLLHSSFENEQRQIWIISKYMPPMKRELVDQIREIKGKRFGFIPKTERYVEKVKQPTTNPLTYNGKRGEYDWIRFDYYMPVYKKGEDRRGESSILSVAVPPHIAAQIDEAVAKNVYFPDAFLKAMYPGYIGQDIDHNLKRMQATELQVLDVRVKPEKSEVLKYPQPLSY